ncbi:MAG TPA: adenine deaminase [Bacteriovoracaceae bacterium]|nr:adenine deaminase [Bacteriovoracaceae bacterium]
MQKQTQSLSMEELIQVLAVARGDRPADLLIKNVKILDLVCGEILESALVLAGKTIAGVGPEYHDAAAIKVWDANGLTVVPGFIDGHLHIESSMMNPFEFEKMTLPLGTTTAICDPHEITNVLGDDGFSWFLRCAQLMQQNLFVQVSSCVPALPGHENSGATFSLEQMKQYHDDSYVLGMAEMMNFPGVINGAPEVLEKILAFSDMAMDGHCPLLVGKALNGYLAAGIQTCHETISAAEGREKIQKGMSLIIREGSVAKNLDALAPLLTEFNSSQCFLCTDDRNPLEIAQDGHINSMIYRLINQHKIPLAVAYRVASFSAAKHFGLKRLGLVAPGYQADLVFLSDLAQVKIEEVFIKGRPLAELGLEGSIEEKLRRSKAPLQNTMKRRPLAPELLTTIFSRGNYNVIEIIPGEIVTNHKKIFYDGAKFEDSDVLKIAVIERHGKNIAPSLGLVKGFGLSCGAIASSVAHDSHNIIVVGKDEEDMACAVNNLIKIGGGFCVAERGKICAQLALQIAGIISKDSAKEIAASLEKLKKETKRLGVLLPEPFLQLAFLALPVIPTLKITDMGLFDVRQFKFISLKD